LIRLVVPIKRLSEKLAYFLVTLFLVVTLNFILFRVIPGDPVRLLFRDPRLTPQDLVRLKSMFGLDQPLHVQYYLYLVNLLRGNLGVSFQYGQPVLNVVAERLGNTVLLVGLSFVFFTVIGVCMGILGAWKHGGRLDTFCISFALTTYSAPVFWVAMLFILVFSVTLHLLPTSGMTTYGGISDSWSYLKMIDLARHLALPLICLILLDLGQYTLITRTSLLDAFTEDYILTARAKGLSNWQIIRKHALRNAMLPTLTMTALNLGFVVGGAIQIETVFSWPGIGILTYQALLFRDYPLLQGAFLIIATVVLTANFVVDILYTWLDPRVRY
jgi:peptide/nickel transport system permease protein